MLIVAVGIGWAFRGWVMFWGLDYVNPWGSIGAPSVPEFALGLYLGDRLSNGLSLNLPAGTLASTAKLVFPVAVLALAIPLSGTKAGMIVVPFLRAGPFGGYSERPRGMSHSRDWKFLSTPLCWIGRHCYAIYLGHHFVILVLINSLPLRLAFPTQMPLVRLCFAVLPHRHVCLGLLVGFPGPEVVSEKPADVYRIMVSGDAFESAEGVDTEQAWPRLLQQNWNRAKEKELEVLNFSITGYGPQQYATVAEQFVAQFQPDLIIISLFVNDFKDVGYLNEN